MRFLTVLVGIIICGGSGLAQSGYLPREWTSSARLKNGSVEFELVNLNRYINKWFVLNITGNTRYVFHIENVFPHNRLSLAEGGILIENGEGASTRLCALWDKDTFDIRKVDFDSYKNPFFPLCEGALYLRLKRNSRAKLSLTEWATERLRRVKFGENLINFVKPIIVSAHAEDGGDRSVIESDRTPRLPVGLQGARINSQKNYDTVVGENHLGIALENKESFIRYGRWYRTKLYPNIFSGFMMPALISEKVLESYSERIKQIDKSEMEKLVYLVAYNLSDYSINFVHGTTYPGIEEPSEEEGSAGASSYRGELALAGTVPPYMVDQTVSVFIGGYKRSHGYFKYGEHAGKYYGYIENGVVLSKMVSGLATIYSTARGDVNIIKWPEDEEKEKELFQRVVSARQNGVMIIDNYKPGIHVDNWGRGNWSGDVNGNLRTLRSAVCIQNFRGEKHLIFGAFTAATPGTMARIFQAYSCENAMQLDMNAFVYLHNAIFAFDGNNEINIEYLHSGMEYPQGLKRHRYILDNNNRDFFYVLRKERKRVRTGHFSAAPGFVPELRARKRITSHFFVPPSGHL